MKVIPLALWMQAASELLHLLQGRSTGSLGASNHVMPGRPAEQPSATGKPSSGLGILTGNCHISEQSACARQPGLCSRVLQEICSDRDAAKPPDWN